MIRVLRHPYRGSGKKFVCNTGDTNPRRKLFLIPWRCRSSFGNRNGRQKHMFARCISIIAMITVKSKVLGGSLSGSLSIKLPCLRMVCDHIDNVHKGQVVPECHRWLCAVLLPTARNTLQYRRTWKKPCKTKFNVRLGCSVYSLWQDCCPV